MAKYFVYKKEVETSEGKSAVYVVRPSFWTQMNVLTPLQMNRRSYDTLDEARLRISTIKTVYETEPVNSKVQIVTDRLSFFTPASSWGSYEGKFERRHRIPVGRLEEFSKRTD
ncbi:hypothetical protein KA107_02955 [Candidatus Pacearchaeota archaeon]|nr:hypothetical protein [Candidatus Pacearchaeota archaeon]